MKRKKWLLAAEHSAGIPALTDRLGLGGLAARVLAARGFDTEEKADHFLHQTLEDIHDPFLLKDMDKAVDEIRRAIETGVKIAVYGDYDVDGVTSTCIMIQYLRKMGADCTYYIPDRLGEGYGLNVAAIRSLYDDGCRLLITVDSGITAEEEARFAKEIGLRLIITDHHECKENVPEAVAVVNPRRPDSDYPFRELAGVGVAFKLICALEKGRPVEELMREYADVVAVGTIADVMPLVGENRVIVSYGLGCLRQTKNQGLRALMQKLGLDSKPVTSNSVSFVMAPRINAAGRLGGASIAARMFLTDDPAEASELADRLCELNHQRQEEENGIYEQIMRRIREKPELTRGRTMTLWGDNWHNGVIGIVSSRLSDRYGIPCVLISMNGDDGKGSGRSIKGFNLYAALEKNAALLEKYGGHELAVGLTVKRENLEALRDALEECAACGGEEEIVPCVNVDCRVEPEELTVAAVKGLSVMEPFGMGNPQPVFLMNEVRIEEITPISHDRHIKLHLSKNGRCFNAFVFGMGAKSCRFVKGDLLDIVFSAEINTYRDNQTVQLVVKDVRWSEEEEAADSRALSVYRAFSAGDTPDQKGAQILCPTRDELVALFRHIKANGENGVLCEPAATLYRKLRYESRACCRMNEGKLLICLDVFRECGIFSYEQTGDDLVIRLLNYQGKADINGSSVLKRLMSVLRG
ncbi:MAG: single-stranded-DNA-specific exonuclease RecJ [Clostridia bacterium]|jgi:single-stranded-DNA-specific exonuclease RecJ|nr:single-stranded-DNA-specific exonuclease RecJ [Clostridia bacterium]